MYISFFMLSIVLGEFIIRFLVLAGVKKIFCADFVREVGRYFCGISDKNLVIDNLFYLVFICK